jgi:hypothetical protein
MTHDNHHKGGEPRGGAAEGDSLSTDPGCELIVLARYNDVPDAELARGELEANGIPAFVFDENMVGAQWFYSLAMGGMRLMVRARDAAEAAEILGLEPVHDEEFEREAGVTEEIYCPKCGSKEITRGYSSKFGWHWLAPIGLFLTYVLPSYLVSGVLLLICPWSYRCKSCRYIWRYLRAKDSAL